MTDKAIIKALEYCSTGEPCFFCFYQKQCEETDLSQHALDLINRQQAEVEKLKDSRDRWKRNALSFDEASRETEKELEKLYAEIERLQNECFCIANERDAIADCLDTAVEEAIKAFAENLKGTCYTYSDICGYSSTVIDINEIDNLVKEMVGDAE